MQNADVEFAFSAVTVCSGVTKIWMQFEAHVTCSTAF